MKRAPLSPEDVTQRDQVRLTLDLMTAGAALSGTLLAAEAIPNGDARSGAIAVMLGGFAVLLVAYARRILAEGRVESAVTVMAVASTAVILVSGIVLPYSALIVAALLIPITGALPYLSSKPLRRLMLLAWGVTLVTSAAALPAGPSAIESADTLRHLWGPAVISGLVLFLLYQSSEKLKASSRDFRRLFSLSSDLAETTDPGLLGDLVARHLAEATGMDDCVIYALSSETDRLTPFGSHPAKRSLETEADSLMERPMLGRVIHDPCAWTSTPSTSTRTRRSELV
jgi:hypothetical protein